MYIQQITLLFASLALAATPSRPSNVCPDNAYLIKNPAPQSFRCLAPVRPTAYYQRRARITTQTTDFYGCNKQCFIDPNCKAQLFEPTNDGSGTGQCTTYNRAGGKGSMKLMKASANAQFSNKECLYTPSCLQIQVTTPNNPFTGFYWTTVQQGNLPTVVLQENPQYYYFDIQGALISDENGYTSFAAYAFGEEIGTPGLTPPVSFPDQTAQDSGDYSFTTVSCGFDWQAFTCGSQAGGILFACADNVLRQSKDTTPGLLPGCSVLDFTLIR